MNTDWPFCDKQSTAVFTSERILQRIDWIHYVTHDAEDGAWQFHPYSGPTVENEAVVVSLETIVRIDKTVAKLHDLPIGWHAWRDSINSEWIRERIRH